MDDAAGLARTTTVPQYTCETSHPNGAQIKATSSMGTAWVPKQIRFCLHSSSFSSGSMPIHISTADFDTDWPAIWQVLLESSEDACLSFDQHRDFASQALKETEDEWRRRMVEHVKKTYATDPTSYIVKAVDTNFGNIVGVALWNIYTTSSGLKGATTKQNKWKIYGDEDMTQDANGVQERQVSAMKLVGYPHVCKSALGVAHFPN